MLKILTIIVLVAGLSWYWVKTDLSLGSMAVSPSQPPYPAAEKSFNAQIEDYLKMIIVGNVRKQLPNAKNLNFTNFSISNVTKQNIRADFKYTFQDTTQGTDNLTVDGFALLSKKMGPDSSVETWKVDKWQATKNHITFEEGLVTKVTKKL